MATVRATPEERAQAAQLVLRRVERGYSMGEAVEYLAAALEVSEDTLRRWVRQEQAVAAVDLEEEYEDEPEPERDPVYAAAVAVAAAPVVDRRPREHAPAPDLLGEYRAEQERRRQERLAERQAAFETELLERSSPRLPRPYWQKATAAFSSGVAAVALCVFGVSVFSGGGVAVETLPTGSAAAQTSDTPTTEPTEAPSLVGNGGVASTPTAPAPSAAPASSQAVAGYELNGVRFEATFPNPPTRTVQPIEVAGSSYEVAAYSAVCSCGNVYQVAALTVPPGEPIVTDEATNQALMPPGARIVDTKRIRVQGHEGSAYTIEGVIDGVPVQMRGMAVIVDRTIVYVHGIGANELTHVDKFMNSFRLL